VAYGIALSKRSSYSKCSVINNAREREREREREKEREREREKEEEEEEANKFNRYSKRTRTIIMSDVCN